MPEGPEIWRTGDRLNDALAGKEVREIYFAFDELKEFEDALIQVRIQNIRPRGKALLTHFENGYTIYTHNQLYGKWMINESGEIPDTNRQLRLAIHNHAYTARLYSASEIEVLSSDDLSNHPYLQKLGPDILHPETDFDTIFERYSDTEFQNRSLTGLLLDQGFIGGIGNYLRSEILFHAGINPFLTPAELNNEQMKRLAESSIRMARRSYETGGITTDPGIVEALKREGKKRSAYRRFVYKRSGKFCFRCGTVIESEKIGGRKLYYCPRCQLDE